MCTKKIISDWQRSWFIYKKKFKNDYVLKVAPYMPLNCQNTKAHQLKCLSIIYYHSVLKQLHKNVIETGIICTVYVFEKKGFIHVWTNRDYLIFKDGEKCRHLDIMVQLRRLYQYQRKTSLLTKNCRTAQSLAKTFCLQSVTL